MRRLRAIFDAGITPQGFVLVHEAPMLLKAPAATRAEPNTWAGTISSPQATADFAAALETGFSVVASLLVPMAYLFLAAAFVDPILVAMTHDGYWIEIDRWNTE
jgi:hypothetical protein